MPRKEFKPQILRPTVAGPDISTLFEQPAAPTEEKPVEPAPPATESLLAAVTASPAAEPASPAQAEPTPLRPRRRVERAAHGSATPAVDPEDEAGFVPIFTYLGAETESAIHQAAYRRSGEAAKSEIVREALEALRTALEQAEPAEREQLARNIRSAEADDRSRTSRIYRIRPSQKQWLHQLAGAERLPMAATVRWAISSWLQADDQGR